MNVCETYDFIVIGGGSAGYAAARTANELGAKVAVVDDAEELGGLCILRGCMPSKTLIYSSEILNFARQGKVFGFEDSRPRADLALMQRRKKEIIAEFADYRAAQLKDGRFSLYRSKAKFVDQSSIEFTDGKTIKGDRFVLATRGLRAACRAVLSAALDDRLTGGAPVGVLHYAEALSGVAEAFDHHTAGGATAAHETAKLS